MIYLGHGKLSIIINMCYSVRHKTNTNYGNLMSDKVDKRVAKNLSFFYLLYQTLNFHNWHLFCVFQCWVKSQAVINWWLMVTSQNWVIIPQFKVYVDVCGGDWIIDVSLAGKICLFLTLVNLWRRTIYYEKENRCLWKLYFNGVSISPFS